jgi:DNA modification methylase
MLLPKFEANNPLTQVYIGDCRHVLDQLDTKFSLIFADPPFNWDVDYQDWNDSQPRQNYLTFTHEWLKACVDKLTDNGSIWINIPDDTAAEIVVYLKSLGLEMINWCIWHFRFGQHRNTSFIVSKVHALYFAKDKVKRMDNTWVGFREIIKNDDHSIPINYQKITLNE